MLCSSRENNIVIQTFNAYITLNEINNIEINTYARDHSAPNFS